VDGEGGNDSGVGAGERKGGTVASSINFPRKRTMEAQRDYFPGKNGLVEGRGDQERGKCNPETQDSQALRKGK